MASCSCSCRDSATCHTEDADGAPLLQGGGPPDPRSAVRSLAAAYPWLIWLVVVLSAVALFLNAISRSAGERRLWVPVTAALLLSSLLVALTAT